MVRPEAGSRPQRQTPRTRTPAPPLSAPGEPRDLPVPAPEASSCGGGGKVGGLFVTRACDSPCPTVSHGKCQQPSGHELLPKESRLHAAGRRRKADTVVRPLPQHEPLGASFPWLLREGVTPKAPHPGWRQPKGRMLGGPQVHALKSYPGRDGVRKQSLRFRGSYAAGVPQWDRCPRRVTRRLFPLSSLPHARIPREGGCLHPEKGPRQNPPRWPPDLRLRLQNYEAEFLLLPHHRPAVLLPQQPPASQNETLPSAEMAPPPSNHSDGRCPRGSTQAPEAGAQQRAGEFRAPAHGKRDAAEGPGRPGCAAVTGPRRVHLPLAEALTRLSASGSSTLRFSLF